MKPISFKQIEKILNERQIEKNKKNINSSFIGFIDKLAFKSPVGTPLKKRVETKGKVDKVEENPYMVAESEVNTSHTNVLNNSAVSPRLG